MVDEEAGELIDMGLDKCGKVEATKPKSSKSSATTEEPSSLAELSANGLGGVSCCWCC